MGGSDTLPGFFGGKYAMVPLGFSYRQQIVAAGARRASTGQVLPAPAGADGLTQGVSPQTLSVAEDSPHKKEAAEFIDFLLRPRNMVRLALGDWMLPTGTEALADPALRTDRARLGHRHRPRRATCARRPPSRCAAIRSGRTRSRRPRSRSTTAGRSASASCEKRLVEDGNLVLARYQR